jgi:anti-sigma factor RsiW
MQCREFVERITDFLEDALRPLDRLRFEAHVPRCPGCRAYLEQMRQMIGALGRLADTTVSPAVTANLLRRFRELRQT